MGDWQGEQNWSNYNQQDWNQGQQVSYRGEGRGSSARFWLYIWLGFAVEFRLI